MGRCPVCSLIVTIETSGTTVNNSQNIHVHVVVVVHVESRVVTTSVFLLVTVEKVAKYNYKTCAED